jgi:hypothetical protein
MNDWTRTATGWIDERNFEIDTAQIAGGYAWQARVIGFPLMKDHNAYASAEAAKEAAVTFLEQQFTAKVTLES